MKHVIPIILFLILLFVLYKLQQETSKEPVYIKGKETIRIVKDTIPYYDTIPVSKISYETVTDTIPYLDTIRVISETVSTFKDSTDKYLLTVKAYSPEPVRKFIFDLKLYQDSIIISRTDTLIKTEEKIDYTYLIGAFALGLLL